MNNLNPARGLLFKFYPGAGAAALLPRVTAGCAERGNRPLRRANCFILEHYIRQPFRSRPGCQDSPAKTRNPAAAGGKGLLPILLSGLGQLVALQASGREWASLSIYWEPKFSIIN